VDRAELEKRTKKFAMSVIELVGQIGDSTVLNVIGRQRLKSGTSIGANYREAVRAVSRADFLNKLGIVEKEAGETEFWLELLCESKAVDECLVLPLLKENHKLLSIFVATVKTTKKNK
jgi:four helix bundle protein